MYVYIFLVNFHLWFSMLPRKHWPLEWELTAELCNTWSGTQSLMVIKGEQERNTKGFPWVGWVVFGWDDRGWKTATRNGPQDMQQPFIQEWEGGTGQGPMCPCGVCLKLDLQSQVILFKYIQEMKKNNPKTNKQKTKKKQTQESCGFFFIFTKLMNILWCNRGLFSDHNKMSDYNKKRYWKASLSCGGL